MHSQFTCIYVSIVGGWRSECMCVCMCLTRTRCAFGFFAFTKWYLCPNNRQNHSEIIFSGFFLCTSCYGCLTNIYSNLKLSTKKPRAATNGTDKRRRRQQQSDYLWNEPHWENISDTNRDEPARLSITSAELSIDIKGGRSKRNENLFSYKFYFVFNAFCVYICTISFLRH